MVCALIPIIIVEALVIQRVLGISFRDSLRGATLANLASTFIGVPVAWGIMLGLQFAVGIVALPVVIQGSIHQDSPVFQILTLPTKVPSDSLGQIGRLKRTSDKSLLPMALGSCGHRITHQLRPINMNGRSILSVTSIIEILAIAWLQTSTLWRVSAAAGLLLIPCFIVSLRIERPICIRSWPGSEATAVRRGVLYANATSYALLFTIACWFTYQFFAKR